MPDQVQHDFRDFVRETFQSVPFDASPWANSVATDPGATQLTRMLSYRSSCIIASENAFTPAFDAQYAAPFTNGFVPERLLMLTIDPPPRWRRCGIAA